MYTNRQILFNYRPTGGADLASSLRVDLNDLNTSFFRFVFQGCEKVGPANIGDRSGQPAVPKHVFDAQALHCDQAESTSQIQGSLVVKITSFIADLGVKHAQTINRLLAIHASKFLAGYRSLYATKLGQFRFQECGILDNLTVGSGKEGTQPQVNADLWVGRWGNCNFAQVAGKHQVPFFGLVLNRKRLDYSLRFPVQLNLDQADMLKPQPVSIQSDTITMIGVLNRIKPAPCFESWVSGIFARLNAPKEVLKGSIKTPHRGLGTVGVQPGKPFIYGALRRKPSRLLKIVYRTPFFFPRLIALSKARVVEPSMRFQHRFQLSNLIPVWVEAVFEGAAHLLTVHYTPSGGRKCKAQD